MDYLEAPSNKPNTGLMVLGFIIVIAIVGFAAYWFMKDNSYKNAKQSKSIVVENVQPKNIKNISKSKKDEEEDEEEFVNKNIVDVISKNILNSKSRNKRYKKLNSTFQ